jgi:hypothetical protein
MEQRTMAMDRSRPESARTQALRDKVALLTDNIEEMLRGALHLAHLISLADPAIEEDRAAIASAALEVGGCADTLTHVARDLSLVCWEGRGRKGLS